MLVSPVWLCNPMDCSPPGCAIHGIPQATVRKWVAIPFSRGSSWPRDQAWVSRFVGRFLYPLSHRGSPSRNKMPNKIMHLNLRSIPHQSMEKLSFLKPVPGARKLGSHRTGSQLRHRFLPWSWVCNAFRIPAHFLLLYLVFISLCHSCLRFQLVVSFCAQISGDIFMA